MTAEIVSALEAAYPQALLIEGSGLTEEEKEAAFQFWLKERGDEASRSSIKKASTRSYKKAFGEKVADSLTEGLVDKVMKHLKNAEAREIQLLAKFDELSELMRQKKND